MVDRLQIEDDTRNKVNKTTNIVTLSKPFQKKIENGFYISRLLNEIYPTFSKRSEKQFQCSLAEIDPESAGFNQPTWKAIFDLLHLYGVELNAKRRDIILTTHNTISIIELIDALFEIDNSPAGQLGNATKRKLDIKTTFGTKKSMAVRQQTSPLVHQDSFNSRMSDLPTMTPQKMPNSVASPRKHASDMSPISNRKQQQNIQASPTLGRQLLGKEATLVPKYDALEDGFPQTLAQCKTSVQFILISLSLAFEMKPKQAASLLVNNHQILTHLCIKGGKGSDYSQVQSWYELILPQAQQLVTLTVTERVDISSYETQVTVVSKSERVNENRSKVLYKTLNILKTGFYSKNSEVVDCCIILFTKLFEAIYQTDRGNDGYEWLIVQTQFPEIKKPAKGILSNRGSIDNDVPISKELDQFRFQTGLKAVIYAYNNNSRSSSTIVQLLSQLSKLNEVDLLTNRLKEQSESYSQYGVICLDMFMQAEAMDYQSLEPSGVMKQWTALAIKVAETSQGVTINDRIVAICLAAEIWRLKPQPLERSVLNVSETIVRILKTAARDIKRTIVVVSIELLFRLLDSFSQQGHQSAAIIFKTLTFLLIEFYWEVDIREIMLEHFKNIFQAHDLPIDTVCEPMLKQIEVSEYHQASFNVFDFEFFSFISSHQQLSLQSGLLLITALSKIALSSVVFQQFAIGIMLQLMQRYNNRIELVQTWRENAKNILTTLVAIQSKLVMHRIQLRQEEGNFYNRLALKNKQKESKSKLSDREILHAKLVERLIVNLFAQVQRSKHAEINKMLQEQLIDTHLSIQAGLKQDCKAIMYLLQFYSNKVDVMIEERAAKHQAASQFIVIPFLQEIQQLESAKGVHAPGAVDIYAKRNSQSPIKGGSKLVQASTDISVALALNSPAKRVKEVPQVLYDYNKWEEEWEIDLYNTYLKRHNKLVQNLHKSYVYENAAKKPLAVDKLTFDELKVVNDQIPVQSLIKLIKDFKLQNGLAPQYLKEEVQKLVKAVNISMQHSGDLLYLSFPGFVNFLLQYAHYMWGGNLKAHQLIEQLFNEMSQQPKFKELNLVMLKTETTNRKDVEVMLKLEQLGGDEILNHKRIDDKQKFVEHLVPDSLPMREHKKICIELMDEIVFKAFGSHFLEPITIEKTVSKVIPQMHSRRSINITNNVNQPAKGRTSNEPLSHQVILTADQEIAKKQYQEKFEKKKQKDTASNVDQKVLFKSQAINRRAGDFGHAIQLQVINCPAGDKQTMFEAGEVLNELLNAVSQGKKALRLDYTPYKIYNLYKKKLPGPPVVEETEQSVDIEEQNKKKEKVKSQMARIENEMKLQKEQRQLEKKIKLEESEKLERLKAARIEEYQQVAGSVQKEGEKSNRDRLEQKLAKDSKQKEIESREQEEMRKRSELVQQKYLDQLKVKAEEYKKQTIDKAQKEMQDQELRQIMSEKQTAMHKRKVENLEVMKNDKRDKFYAWVSSQPIQQLINKKYKKGLYLKFDQCLKIGQKNYGCSQSAWLEWLKQAGIFSKIDAKQAIRIHSTQIKEMEALENYDKWFKTDTKQGEPGDKELSYGAFVSALIKVANVVNIMTAQQQMGSKANIKEYQEYKIPDQADIVFENLMVLLNVSGNSGKVQEIVAPSVAAVKQSPTRGKTPKKEERKEEPKKGFFDFLMPKPKVEEPKTVKTADPKQLAQKK